MDQFAEARQEASLREVVDFGANPGDLRMLACAPVSDRTQRPLVVVLHGCTQTAAGYDAASGWSRLAETHGFVVLYAEQRRANNDQTCFSWFRPADVTRGGGEVESIREMIATAVERFAIDERRIYVTGLSAGGAMACAMLATHPELFAAGAIVAGLPYGAATSVGEAFDAMIAGRVRDAKVWGGLVRAAAGASHEGRWPTIAIWQGTADHVVKAANADELVKQWVDVHGIGDAAPEQDTVGPAQRSVWRDADGRARVTRYTLPGFGHGAPVDAATPPAPFFIPAGLSATDQIAADFGLTAPAKPRARRLLSMIGLGE